MKLLVVAGPTASGKSDLGIKLAQYYNGEIISADSMQIYKGLDIGTAKVKHTEGVKHHLIDVIEPDQPFSAEEFKLLATQAAEEISKEGKLPIVVGGTGLYIHSLLYKLEFGNAEADPELRAELMDYYHAHGALKLHEILSQLDKDAAERIHPNNVKRVIRAIEICKKSGAPKSAQENSWNQKDEKFEPLIIGLCAKDRQLLYDRINARVDRMIEEGLEAEVFDLYNSVDPGAQSLQAIGYKELISYFKGDLTREQAIDLIKQETRRYAKRQMVWFKRDKSINWIEIDNKSIDDLFNEAKEIIESKGL